LQTALRGDGSLLKDLLVRYGGYRGTEPSLKLAAAFGSEVARMPGPVGALLTNLADEDAPAESPRVFLPIAAAHGWAQRVRAGQDVEPGWRALQELAADDRTPVRLGTLDALIGLAIRDEAGDLLVQRGREWLDSDERELCFGSTSLIVEALGDVRVLPIVRDHEALLSYLSDVIDKTADAPRSATRSDGRRRVLTSLAFTLAAVVALVRRGDRGSEWFRAECERATHPDLRGVLSQALLKLANTPHAPAASAVDQLRSALQASAKPIRDIARIRPGTGRGRRTRDTR
jgi:hypothetical protein